jgi:ketosteroid isomerase-like protein
VAASANIGGAAAGRSTTPRSGTVTEDHVTDADVAELVELMSEAASAFIGGDMRRYFALMQHTEDFTLMPPTGGDTVRQSQPTDGEIAEMERFFQHGEATLEVVETYASGNLAVLVVVERQHGTVGDLPEQDWSLRVTLVFRREGSTWRLVHRHADALVHPIPFEHLGVLARGEIKP